VELNPTNVAAVGNLGTAYFMEGAFVQALQMQKRSAGLNPTNFIPYQITGWIYRLLGDLDNAEIWLNRSIELSPKYDTYELLAYTYTCQGKRKEALDLIPLVLKLDENDPLVLETAGLIANFAGDASLAKTYFLRNMQMHEIVNRDPMFSGNIHLAQIYLRENNVVDAEVLLTAALELNMTEIRNGSLERAFPFNVAAIYAIRGKSEEAIHWIDKAIAMNWVDYAQLTHGPLFMSMRNHPELIKRVKQLSNKMQEMKQKAAEM
jgi:tetratricopeptide (TPR) repeat protein